MAANMQFLYANILSDFVIDAEVHKYYIPIVNAARKELSEFDSRMASENNRHKKQKERTGKQDMKSADGDDSSWVEKDSDAATNIWWLPIESSPSTAQNKSDDS